MYLPQIQVQITSLKRPRFQVYIFEFINIEKPNFLDSLKTGSYLCFTFILLLLSSKLPFYDKLEGYRKNSLKTKMNFTQGNK